MTTEKKLCAECTYALARNIPYSLDTVLCSSCRRKFKVSQVIPATHDQYAKRDLTDRIMKLIDEARRST